MPDVFSLFSLFTFFSQRLLISVDSYQLIRLVFFFLSCYRHLLCRGFMILMKRVLGSEFVCRL